MSKTSQKWGQKSTEIELKSRCLFSKCFHGPKREPKKPLNKGLFQLLILFELGKESNNVNIIVYYIYANYTIYI